MIEFIYALCIKDGKPFYVGRTNEPPRRLREHNYEKKDGTELKYQYIRDLESNNIEWEMIILEEVGPDTEHYEDFWVYKLIKEGYDLTNQKAGDARSIATETLRSRNFTSAKEFLFELDKEEAEEKDKSHTRRCSISQDYDPSVHYTRVVVKLTQSKKMIPQEEIEKCRTQSLKESFTRDNERTERYKDNSNKLLVLSLCDYIAIKEWFFELAKEELYYEIGKEYMENK
jgi:hypothetical protein